MTPEALEPEEPWETEIGSLLGSLPAVDPPDGFIAAALNRRPLHAGRTLTGLVLVAAGALGISLFAGSTGASLVIPEVELLAQRHLAAQADLSSDQGSVESSVEPDDDLSVVVPEGYERAATIDADDLRQAVYARGGAALSVFVENGRIDWDEMPTSGRTTTVGGTQAWIDDERTITVVQAGDEVIAVVGLSAEDVATLIGELPGDGPSVADRVDDLVSAIAGQLGFPSE